MANKYSIQLQCIIIDHDEHSNALFPSYESCGISVNK
jgi:hypothetical protein